MAACGRFRVEDVLLAAMELTTILNQCYPQPGFVYLKARFRADKRASTTQPGSSQISI
jgi:hypothetical protein